MRDCVTRGPRKTRNQVQNKTIWLVNKSDNLKLDSIRTVVEGFAGDPEGVELNFTCKSHAIKSDWIKVSNICLSMYKGCRW